jgi:hypothetical protein
MNWLRSFRLHAVAKRYALRLPKYLRHAYLDSEFYTHAQIVHAVEALRLPRNYIDLAYAAYLPKVAYDEIRAKQRLPLRYEDARHEFYRHLPEPESSDDWNPLTRSSVVGVPYTR